MRWLAAVVGVAAQIYRRNRPVPLTIPVSRFKLSYVFIVVIQSVPLCAKLICPTSAELARYQYVAELVPSETVESCEAAS